MKMLSQTKLFFNHAAIVNLLLAIFIDLGVFSCQPLVKKCVFLRVWLSFIFFLRHRLLVVVFIKRDWSNLLMFITFLIPVKLLDCFRALPASHYS